MLSRAPCPGTPEPRGVAILGSGECGVTQIFETYALAGKTSAAVVSFVNSTTSACESLDPTTVASFFRHTIFMIASSCGVSVGCGVRMWTVRRDKLST